MVRNLYAAVRGGSESDPVSSNTSKSRIISRGKASESISAAVRNTGGTPTGSSGKTVKTTRTSASGEVTKEVVTPERYEATQGDKVVIKDTSARSSALIRGDLTAGGYTYYGEEAYVTQAAQQIRREQRAELFRKQREVALAKQQQRAWNNPFQSQYRRPDYVIAQPMQTPYIKDQPRGQILNITEAETGLPAVAGRPTKTVLGQDTVEAHIYEPPQERTRAEKVYDAYMRVERKVGSYLPSIETYMKGSGAFQSAVFTPIKAAAKNIPFTSEMKETATRSYGTSRRLEGGIYKEIKERPVATVASFALGGVVGGAAKALTAFRIGSTVVKAAGAIATGVYGGYVISETVKAEDKAEFLGREIVRGSAFIAGAGAGAGVVKVKSPKPAYLTKEWYVQEIVKTPRVVEFSWFTQGKGVKELKLKDATVVDYADPKMTAKGLGSGEFSDYVLRFQYPTKIQAYRIKGEMYYGEVIKVGGTTYQTTTKMFMGKSYSVRSVVDSSGVGRATVFRAKKSGGIKVIEQLEFRSDQTFTFSEPQQIKKKEGFIQNMARAKEYEITIKQQEVINLLSPGSKTAPQTKIEGKLTTFSGQKRFAQITKPYRIKREFLTIRKEGGVVDIDTNIDYQADISKIQFVKLSEKVPQQAYIKKSEFKTPKQFKGEVETEFPATYLTVQSSRFEVYGKVTITKPKSTTERMFKDKRGLFDISTDVMRRTIGETKTAISRAKPKIKMEDFSVHIVDPKVAGRLSPFIVPTQIGRSDLATISKPISVTTPIKITRPVSISKPISVTTPIKITRPVSISKPTSISKVVAEPASVSQVARVNRLASVSNVGQIGNIAEVTLPIRNIGGLRPTPTTPPPPPTPFLPSREGQFIRRIKRRKIKTKQPKAYTPTAYAAVGEIEGKATKGGIKTGLGLRPIKKKVRAPKLRLIR